MSDQNDRPRIDPEGISREPTVTPAEDVEAPAAPAADPVGAAEPAAPAPAEEAPAPETTSAPAAAEQAGTSPEAPSAEAPAPAAPQLREIDESHAATMDDGSVVRWESWSLGEETKKGNEVRIPVIAEGAEVAEYVRIGPEEAIATAQGAWDLDVVGDGRLVATLPDGRVFTAGGKDRPKLSRAKKIDVDLGGDRRLYVVCEGAQNYVIEDERGGKLGQFTGANRGVRSAEIQYDTDAGRALPDEEKIFLSWVARRVLEFRMISSTWILTVCLLLLIAYLVWVWVS
ncbi:hypothetical protein ACFORJ_07110 [Corynebacterium hansenii]|uniref:Uncharacterized protein n=1 Tax=Corynebacterium hansenii TaxID=394964 RepID=A0ABV7ZR77_9CORY|nr:hypothetical protein [Corynebacterium hansenii]WJZ00515.1 hypothetical protein CHAN_09560 [Corynebacterium hansenii]